jgi:hypothetical protein
VVPISARIIICLCGLLFALALVVWFVMPTPPPPASRVSRTGERLGGGFRWRRVGDKVGARRRWKRPFDNHLEGSSIERDSRVAEAMSHRRSHPIEETSDATLRRN